MTAARERIGIAGFGMEGRALYEHFKDSAEVHIFDDQEKDLAGVDAVFHRGLVIPASIDTVYKSPGIPTAKLRLESPLTKISTLMDLALHAVRDRAVGVTGTKGKSTTASLIFHVLHETGRDVTLFGNIGIADLRLIEGDIPERSYVFELSSYQCEHLSASPHVAVLTNLYPEHLNHHGSFERYRDAKLNIVRFQRSGDAFVDGVGITERFRGRHIEPDFDLPFETKLLGAHNQRNCALALAALREFGVPERDIRAHIATFEPLSYRLERVGEFRGISFYDDSLATIPEATLASIEALPRVDTIILGGEDRGIPFDAFARALSQTRVSTFIVFPETGRKMVKEVTDRNVIPVSSMREAVEAAYASTPEGGTVLLSNASPSFNLFKDYRDKSAQYRENIRMLA